MGCSSSVKEVESTSLSDLPVEDSLVETELIRIPTDSIATIEDLDEFVYERDTSELESTIISQGLVNIKEIDPTIQTDIKYSTEDNFMSEDMYGEYAYCYLQPVVADMLAAAQDYVQENHLRLIY